MRGFFCVHTLDVRGSMPSADSVSNSFVIRFTQAQSALDNYIAARILNEADSKDVLQATNLYIWKNAASYDESRPFLPWAYTMAKLQIRKYRLYAKRERLVFDEDVLEMLEGDCEAMPQEDARRDALEFCLKRLSAEDQERVRLRYIEEHSMSWIEHHFSTAANSESVRFYRIRERLRKCIMDRVCELGSHG